MYVFDYSECLDLIQEVVTAAEGDLVFEVTEELSEEGLYNRRASSQELVRFCKKVLTVGIVTAIVYNAYRESDKYYETMLNLIVSKAEEYMNELVMLDVIYEEDDLAYTSDWASFVPDNLPFNIRCTTDIMDIAEIIGGQVLETIHQVDFYEDPEFKRIVRTVNRLHSRTYGIPKHPPELDIDLTTRTYTMTEYKPRRRVSHEANRAVRH